MEDYNEMLDIDTSDAQEPKVVEEGEYLIRITGFRQDNDGNIVRTAASGAKYFILTFDIPSEEFSKGFSQIYSVPSAEMEPKRQNAVKWQLECLKRAFNLEELNFNSMIGREGYALLGIERSEQYGTSNNIKRLITGPTEGADVPF